MFSQVLSTVTTTFKSQQNSPKSQHRKQSCNVRGRIFDTIPKHSLGLFHCASRDKCCQQKDHVPKGSVCGECEESMHQNCGFEKEGNEKLVCYYCLHDKADTNEEARVPTKQKTRSVNGIKKPTQHYRVWLLLVVVYRLIDG